MAENTQNIDDIRNMARSIAVKLGTLSHELRLIQQGIDALAAGDAPARKSGPVQLTVNGKKHTI